MAGCKRFGQRRLVDESPAPGVDQDCTGFEFREQPGIDQHARVGRQRGVQADDVSSGDQRVQRVDELCVEFRFGLGLARATRIDDRHCEPRSPPCNSLPDGAEPDDTERFAVHACAQVRRRIAASPLAVAQVALALTDAPAGAENQRQRKVRRVVGDDRRVADRDAACAGGVEIDIVHADADVGDQPDAVRQARNEAGIDRVERGATVGGGAFRHCLPFSRCQEVDGLAACRDGRHRQFPAEHHEPSHRAANSEWSMIRTPPTSALAANAA